MEPSLAGIFVFAALQLLIVLLRAPVVVGLFASLPFGATAFATISALGGASPPIYALYLLVFIGSIAARRHVLRDLHCVFHQDWVAWLVCLLVVYVIASAILLPRIFMGQTTALVPTNEGIAERLLVPVSGNITQPAYFTLGALSFFALGAYLAGTRNLGAIRLGFFVWAAMHAALGFIDFGAKLSGAGDILEFLRTANYAMLTDVDMAGFSRITGAYSEASAFGGASLACLAFTFAYWRKSESRLALALALASFVLLLLSTSSSAYVSVIIVAMPLLAAILYRAFIGKSEAQDFTLMALMLCCAAVILAIYIYDERILAPGISLFEEAILNKSTSMSALERGYWNQVSFQSFLDTNGFGIGMGSSRASSWPVAVLSQFGVIGTAMLAALLAYLLRGLWGVSMTLADREDIAVVAGMRACVLAALLAACFAGTTADPGLLFFMAIAAVSSCRARFASATHRARSVQLAHT